MCVCVFFTLTDATYFMIHKPSISSIPVCVLDVMVVREASDLLKHTQVFERTVQPAVTQVADLEIDEGVLALLVDGVIGRHRLTSADQCATKGQSYEGFLQHGHTPCECGVGPVQPRKQQT